MWGVMSINRTVSVCIGYIWNWIETPPLGQILCNLKIIGAVILGYNDRNVVVVVFTVINSAYYTLFIIII